MDTSKHNSDRLLQAGRYAHGELASAELVEFEQLLECDLEAQEALADWVLLESALHAVPPPFLASAARPAHAVIVEGSVGGGAIQSQARLGSAASVISHSKNQTSPRSRLSPAAALLSTTAAMTLLVLGGTFLSQSLESLPKLAGTWGLPAVADAETLKIWSLIGEESDLIASPTEASSGDLKQGDLLDDDFESESGAHFSSARQIDIPEWMFAAVEASDTARESSDDSLMDADDEEETL